jgi:hypothetical protein
VPDWSARSSSRRSARTRPRSDQSWQLRRRPHCAWGVESDWSADHDVAVVGEV